MVIFLVVVSVGGAGSILGAIAASLILGLASTLGKYLAPQFGDFFFYLTVIVVVFIFPNGLLGAKD
jgi:branched-chain amino acid transport system permease protein